MTPRGAKPPPLRVKTITQWGDDPSTRREHAPFRLTPLTDRELWDACKQHFPADLLPLAAQRLQILIQRSRRLEEIERGLAKRPAGRPPGGIAAEVEEHCTGPMQWDLRMARRLVAIAHDLPYGQVAELHRTWLKAQKRTAKRGK
jgi:hypothetical protein